MAEPNDPAYIKIKEAHTAYVDAEKSANDQATKAFMAAERSDKNKGYTNLADAMYHLSLAADVKAAEAKDTFVKVVRNYRRIKNGKVI